MEEKYIDLNFAKIDTDRACRRKASEAIFCECKTNEQLLEIYKSFEEKNANLLGTRASVEQYDFLKDKIKNLNYDKTSKVLTLINKEVKKVGLISICTGGTGDIPVAKEASLVAQFYGSNVQDFYDVGVAGIHRLMSNIDEIKKANVIITVAGMEGALSGVIAGMVDVPVIAVPTSIGYGASFEGLSALLTMLNSCAEGITVVNIDNGFNAGYSASQINKKICGA